MKSLTKLLLLALFSLLYTTTANASVSIRIGKNCARFYYNSSERWHNNQVRLDCAFVRRLRHAPKVKGVVFFVAHTYDSKYRTSGGQIVVAVPAKRANAFAHKYGAITRYEHQRQRVKHTPLQGFFRRLEGDIAYLDLSGQNRDLVIERKDRVRRAGIHTRRHSYKGRH